VHRYPGALLQIDVLKSHAADDVEEGYRPAVALVVHGLGQEDRVRDLQAGLLQFPIE
jgi:hypothetical protein